MSRARTPALLLALAPAVAIALSLPACDAAPSTPTLDAGPGDPCTTDEDCDDGVFCTGRERCLSGTCFDTPPSCLETQHCDEGLDRCLSDCTVATDADGDGFDALECGGTDCDDSEPRRHPGAVEICETEDVDEDCDPSTYGVRDGDDDGAPDAACCNVQPDGSRRCGDDCDDMRSVVHPGNTEACDSFDNDCDSRIDESVSVVCYPDADSDSFAAEGATGTTFCACGAGTTSRAPEAGDVDCDDADPGASPLGTEECDPAMRDEDCDGEANPDALCSCADGAMRSCSAPGRCGSGTETCLSGTWSTCTIQPRDELCNAEDDDCDGRTDEGTTVLCASDGDGDGYAPASATPFPACSCPDTATPTLPGPGTTDCDDTRRDVSPVLAEVCDVGGLDENCDGVANPAVDCSCTNGATRACTSPGRCSTGIQTCTAGAWGACSVTPSTEICNLEDDDCDGLTDEGVTRLCYTDRDNDGYARGTTATSACTCATGTTANNPATTGTDCNDSDTTIHPRATEVCDRIDSNCSSGGGTATNEDADNDGFAPSGASCTGGFPRTDCDDANRTIYPGAPELCDRIDSNCSGGSPVTEEDADGDGYAPTGAACSGGYPRTDCNDANMAIHPGAAELCDRVDSDCSTTGPEVSEDFDGDGYAPLGATCTGGPLPRTDCDDTRASIAPCAAGCTGSYYGGHRYAACTTPVYWTAAEAVCEGMNMQLVAIGSAAENTYVRGLLSTTTSPNFWGGGSDSTTEAQWRWRDGTQFWMGGAGGSAVGGAYQAWVSGQPDDSGGQDYLWIRADGAWADSGNAVDRAFVCESP